MKRAVTGLICIALCAAMTGCSLWMDGSYASVTPNRGQETGEVHPAQDLGSSSELIRILSEAVENASPGVKVYTTQMSDMQLRGCISQAVRYTMNTNPIGCYGVREITYEIGTNAGRLAAVIRISYLHNRSEILRMQKAESMDEAYRLIGQALAGCEAEVTMRVSRYQEADLVQMIQTYVDEHPETCMEQPQVSVSTYPEQGTDRVVEIKFSYRNSREVLRSMQQTVQPVFASILAQAETAGTPQGRLTLIYEALAQRHTAYTEAVSITPCYSVLRNGVGDSRALSVVYGALCRDADLDCRLVTGTRDGKARCWNAVLLEGKFYYVDVLHCLHTGKFTLKPFDMMTGYVWDYAAYGEEQPPAGPDETGEQTDTAK